MNEERLRESLGDEWFEVLKEQFKKDYFINLIEFLKSEYKTKTIHPKGSQIFRAFKVCPYDKVVAVIIGQDCYPNEHANGIAFATDLNETPPSLKIIGKKCQELSNIKRDRQLKYLTDQGVLLLNTRLTVESGKPGSHKGKGWERFIAQTCDRIAEKRDVPFICMGRDAQDLVNQSIMFPYNSKKFFAEHPAASLYQKRKWVDNQVFERANDFLIENNKKPIQW